MNIEVREEELPGIGRRYEVSGPDGAVVVVIHHSGRRDLYALPARSEEAVRVTLTDAQARSLAAVLNGSYFTPTAVREVEEVIGSLVIDWLTLTPGSPGTGRSIADLDVRSRTGVAVMAILRGKTTLMPAEPTEVFQAGDRVVVAGARADVAKFHRLVVGTS